MTEDEMVGWHHQLHAHEREQAPGVGDGQESPMLSKAHLTSHSKMSRYTHSLKVNI